MTESLIGFAALFVLILLKMPIGFAMGLVGVAGFAILRSPDAALAMAGQTAFDAGFSYTLSVVPLFIFMGNLVARAGFAGELFEACDAVLGRFRGGLAMAAVTACGGFSAVSGSSLATAATMSKVAMPSMRKFGYRDSLATGSIAAGGTLGILIPPSVILVIYGILTETDIGKLFLAGIVPGLLGIALYAAAVVVVTRLDPEAGPRGTRRTLGEMARAVRRVWGIAALFVVIMGGIYGGVFTPTEAAGVGAAMALALALLRRALTLRILLDILVESARTTAMIFVVLIGALIFTNFINYAGLPFALADAVYALQANPYLVLAAIILVYIVLGCVLESLSMILLTVPVFYPLMLDLDFGPAMDPEAVLIWFAVIVVVVTEISLITPPIGLNVFVLKGVVRDVSLGTIFRGVTPFWLADVVRVALIVAVPALALWLPGRL